MNDNDINSILYAWNCPSSFGKYPGESEMNKESENIAIKVLLKSTRILKRVQEIWRDSQSFRT